MREEGRKTGVVLSLQSSEAVLRYLADEKKQSGSMDPFLLSAALKRLAMLRDYDNCRRLFDSVKKKSPSLMHNSLYTSMISATTKQPIRNLDESITHLNLLNHS